MGSPCYVIRKIKGDWHIRYNHWGASTLYGVLRIGSNLWRKYRIYVDRVMLRDRKNAEEKIKKINERIFPAYSKAFKKTVDEIWKEGEVDRHLKKILRPSEIIPNKKGVHVDAYVVEHPKCYVIYTEFPLIEDMGIYLRINKKVGYNDLDLIRIFWTVLNSALLQQGVFSEIITPEQAYRTYRHYLHKMVEPFDRSNIGVIWNKRKAMEDELAMALFDWGSNSMTEYYK